MDVVLPDVVVVGVAAAAVGGGDSDWPVTGGVRRSGWGDGVSAGLFVAPLADVVPITETVHAEGLVDVPVVDAVVQLLLL